MLTRSLSLVGGLDGGDFEANLEMRMIEDNEDVIIPDDMKHFLQQRQREGQQATAAGGSSLGNTQKVDQWMQQTATYTEPSPGDR